MPNTDNLGPANKWSIATIVLLVTNAFLVGGAWNDIGAQLKALTKSSDIITAQKIPERLAVLERFAEERLDIPPRVAVLESWVQFLDRKLEKVKPEPSVYDPSSYLEEE